MSQLTATPRPLPAFQEIPYAALTANTPLTAQLAQNLSHNAKVAALRPEILLAGFFRHGDLVGLNGIRDDAGNRNQFISPADGYQYSVQGGEVLFAYQLYSSRAPDGNFASGQRRAPGIAASQSGNLFWFTADIDATGRVTLQTSYLDANSPVTNDGILKVWAFCSRAMARLSAIPQFQDTPDDLLVVAQPLRENVIQAINENTNFGSVREEIFNLGYWSANGAILPLPVSPIDGYPYQRAEVRYHACVYSNLAPLGGSYTVVPGTHNNRLVSWNGPFVNGQTVAPTIANGQLRREAGAGPLYWWALEVNDVTGMCGGFDVNHSTAGGFVSYYVQDGAESIAQGDGILRVFAICQRGSSNIAGPVTAGSGGTGVGGVQTGTGNNTGVPDPPIVGVLKNEATSNSYKYNMIFGIDVPVAALNWNAIAYTHYQLATDPNFNNLQGNGGGNPILDVKVAGAPPIQIAWSSNFPGTYYFRASVAQGFGESAFAEVSITTDQLDNLTTDTDLMNGVTPTILTNSGSDAQLGGNELLIQFDIPTLNAATCWGYTVIVNDSGVLPTDVTFDTGSSGAITPGSNVLTDLSKNYTPGSLVGKRIHIFSNKRSVSPTFDGEGSIVDALITANTSTTITCAVPPQQMTRNLTGISYHIMNTGNSWVEEVVAGGHGYVSSAILDQSLISGQPISGSGRLRQFRVPVAFAPAYAWVVFYNAFGMGRIGSSGSASISGLSRVEIKNGEVIASKLTKNAQGWTSNLAFSASSNTTVAWGSGTIQTADGSTYSITAGNTGAMSALTYIYFDPTVSTTVLQVTTNYANATGENAILICLAQNIADATQNAMFQPLVGVMGINNTVIGPNSIATSNIQANSITTSLLAASSVTASKISVASLDAISVNAGTITAGTFVGTTFETATSGQRVTFDSTNGIRGFDSGGAQWFQIPISSKNFLFGLSSTDVSGANIVANGIIAIASATANASVLSLSVVAGTYCAVAANHTGSGTQLPLGWFAGGAEWVELQTAGHLKYFNVAGDPSTPSGGGMLYAKAGALFWKGSSGTVTQIAAA